MHKQWATEESRSQTLKGVEIGKNFVEYSYLGGRVKHFKEVGGSHWTTFGNANTRREITRAILGHTGIE